MSTSLELLLPVLVPMVDPEVPVPGSGWHVPLDDILTWMKWIGGAVAVLAVFFVAANIFLNTRRTEVGQVSSELISIAIGGMLIGSATFIGSTITATMLSGSDWKSGFLTVLNWVAWIVTGLAFIGVLVTAGRMFINNRRGEGVEEMLNLGWIMLGLLLLASAGSLVSVMLGGWS